MNCFLVLFSNNFPMKCTNKLCFNLSMFDVTSQLVMGSKLSADYNSTHNKSLCRTCLHRLLVKTAILIFFMDKTPDFWLSDWLKSIKLTYCILIIIKL